MGNRVIAAVILLTVTMGMGSMAFAQVMESTNYQIQSDSVNFGGGFASSDTYRMEDTMGEMGTGESGSTSYTLRAGYQQMQEVYLALSQANDVTMSPAIGGVTGGSSNGQTKVTAITDAPGGYELFIKASTSPAMEGNSTNASIADYAPGADPSYSFAYASGESVFAFSPEGADVAPRFLDNGADTCATGSSETTDACWDGLTTTDQTIVHRVSGNHPFGTETTIKFKVGVGSTVNQAEDTYTATTTITMVAL